MRRESHTTAWRGDGTAQRGRERGERGVSWSHWRPWSCPRARPTAPYAALMQKYCFCKNKMIRNYVYSQLIIGRTVACPTVAYMYWCRILMWVGPCLVVVVGVPDVGVLGVNSGVPARATVVVCTIRARRWRHFREAFQGSSEIYLSVMSPVPAGAPGAGCRGFHT